MIGARTGDVPLDSNIGVEEAIIYPPLRSRKSRKKIGSRRFGKELVTAIKNIRKRARNSDKEYVTQRNKKVEERRLKFHHRGRCVNHCNDVLPKHKRHEPQLLEDGRLAAAERLHISSRFEHRHKAENKKQTLQYFFYSSRSKDLGLQCCFS